MAAYEQNRTQFNAVAGTTIGTNTNGIEVELNWAVNENFFVTGTATWIKTIRKGTQQILGVPFQYVAENEGVTYEEALASKGALRLNAFPTSLIAQELNTDPEEPGRPDKFFSLSCNP